MCPGDATVPLITSTEEGMKLQTQSRPQNRKRMQEEGSISTPSAPTTPTPSEPNTATSTTKPTVVPKIKKQRTTATLENESGAGSSAEGNAGYDGEGPSESGVSEIELLFRPHPLEMNEEIELISELKNSPIRFIKTTPNATVDHLSKYLAIHPTQPNRSGELKTELPSLSNFCIYISPTPGQYVGLGSSITLEQVHEKYWRMNKPMEMFYSWKKN